MSSPDAHTKARTSDSLGDQTPRSGTGADALTHAGAAVWRQGPEGPVFLLVTARGTTDQWVLPKGHIETGESPEQAAQREVREETGLHVRVGEYLGTETFVSRRSKVTCAYYLAQCTRNAEPATEGRVMTWLPLADAIEKATFPAGRNTLEKARSALLAVSSRDVAQGTL